MIGSGIASSATTSRAVRGQSVRALAVLKVSEDGDITVFRNGQPIVTMLPSGSIR